jgi:hypothetical protein
MSETTATTTMSEATAAVQTSTQVRKAEGHLSHEDQRRIGDILQRLYDEVIREDVPDRFKNLLDQFEKQGQVKEHHEPDHLGGAMAFDKGSRS